MAGLTRGGHGGSGTLSRCGPGGVRAARGASALCPCRELYHRTGRIAAGNGNAPPAGARVPRGTGDPAKRRRGGSGAGFPAWHGRRAAGWLPPGGERPLAQGAGGEGNFRGPALGGAALAGGEGLAGPCGGAGPGRRGGPGGAEGSQGRPDNAEKKRLRRRGRRGDAEGRQARGERKEAGAGRSWGEGRCGRQPGRSSSWRGGGGGTGREALCLSFARLAGRDASETSPYAGDWRFRPFACGLGEAALGNVPGTVGSASGQ